MYRSLPAEHLSELEQEVIAAGECRQIDRRTLCGGWTIR
jgi:hypothetical protein